jgi:phosphoenolpyruvate carboxylase
MLVDNREIPRTISTQHPDNASSPRWSENEVTEGDAELHEAFFSYHDLGCTEVMWDSEGKDVDTNVIRKLLSKYPDFFAKKIIGEDIFLTYRVPNPEVEIIERKILSQTLHSIPLSADVAKQVYKRDSVPIFEVIMPFTTSGKQLVCLDNYYRSAVVGIENLRIADSVTVKDWMGHFKPKRIGVIPLVEDRESLLSIDKIILDYLKGLRVRSVRVKSMRVFLARSDPALNYGIISAVLLSKIALSRLNSLEETAGIRVYPMLGAGSMPFRGHLSPENIPAFLNEYRGVVTVTVQSAFRYDFPLARARSAVSTLNARLPNGLPQSVNKDEERMLSNVVDKLVSSYQARIEQLAPFVNSLSQYVPSRRARKLHIGLFGYSRNINGIAMPRAIPFAAAFYSIGIPPEFIGVSAIENMKDLEWDVLRRFYANIELDFRSVSNLVSWQAINLLRDTLIERISKRGGISLDKFKNSMIDLVGDLSAVEDIFSVHLGASGSTGRRHENFVRDFLTSYAKPNHADARIALTEAAKIRRCIG